MRIIHKHNHGGASVTLKSATEAANVYENKNAENTQDKIDASTAIYRVLKQKISAGRNYKVEEKMTDGIIYAVTVTQVTTGAGGSTGGNTTGG